jgi:hypothetical protein
MRKFRQIPYECDGLQYIGTNLDEVVEMFGMHPDFKNLSIEEYRSHVKKHGLKIHTNWGDIKVAKGQYLLNGKYGLQVLEKEKMNEHFLEITSTQ